ncbi:putative F-box/FBD/LRR-repeat protein At4g03220 isoform X2 [Phoenix dactylifera]|nr:putative F-box/FBD/LRR-repeat protein At4g03220 isoform X2 [Phoenix dactylifera]
MFLDGGQGIILDFDKVMQTMVASESNVQELELGKKKKSQEEADRISCLHDAIIYHIFSFVSTIDVVQTSILARRWRHLWTSVPTLDFDDDEFSIANGEDEFVHFVNKVQSCYKAQQIQRYHLSIKQARNSNFLETWVRFAVEHNVQELYLDLPHGRPFEVSFCQSVRVLKLHGDLKLPASGCFSSLEHLSLLGVQLTNDNGILDVTSEHYPLLRSCSLKSCMGLNCLNINCSLLEHLDVENCFDLDQLHVSAGKLRFLSVQSSFTYGIDTGWVEIAAPSLQTFEWLDYITDNFSIGNFTCLKSAHTSLVFHYHPEKKESYMKNARKFLHHLACAETLHVEMPCLWGLHSNKELLEGLSTKLFNLKHLTLLVSLDDHVLRGVSCLIRSCSNLEILHIHTIDEHIQEELNNSFPDLSHFDQRESWSYQRRPLDHLSEAKIYGFRGKEHEIEFMQFLLEHAITLKRMIILFSGQVFVDQVMKTQMAEKLMKFTKASPDAVVSCP